MSVRISIGNEQDPAFMFAVGIHEARAAINLFGFGLSVVLGGHELGPQFEAS